MQNQSQHNNNNSHTPLIESNDRLRSDELADLPAPDAERLHAAYDIEDHLDSTPDRLLVFGPATPLIELLKQVKQLLIKKKPSDATLTGIHNKTHHHLNSSSSSSVSRHLPNHVYVARVWFQPQHGPEGSYKWEKGGPDLFRFELAHTLQDKLIIKWSPVEVALSQALEVGHQKKPYIFVLNRLLDGRTHTWKQKNSKKLTKNPDRFALPGRSSAFGVITLPTI